MIKGGESSVHAAISLLVAIYAQWATDHHARKAARLSKTSHLPPELQIWKLRTLNIPLLSSASNSGLGWSCFAVADPNMTPGRRGHSTLGGGGGGGSFHPKGRMPPPPHTHTHTVSCLHHCRGFLAWGPLQGGGFFPGGHSTLRQCLLCTTAGVSFPGVRMQLSPSTM